MCCQAQLDSVVSDVDIGVMVHTLSESCHPVQEPNAVCEIFEDEKPSYLFAAQSPTASIGKFILYSISSEPHTELHSCRV